MLVDPFVPAFKPKKEPQPYDCNVKQEVQHCYDSPLLYVKTVIPYRAAGGYLLSGNRHSSRTKMFLGRSENSIVVAGVDYGLSGLLKGFKR